MSVATHLLTADELDQFPDDGKRREVIGGELYVSPAPSTEHQDLSMHLSVMLYRAIYESGAGKVFASPIDVRFSDDDQVQPDLLAIKTDRLDICQGRIVHGAPDIVVEILSPSTESYDRIEKKHLYEQYGVPEYCIVDSVLRQATMSHLIDGRYVETETEDGVLHSTAITDFTIDLAALFAKAEPA
jgi:Uma2 family endonuclease